MRIKKAMESNYKNQENAKTTLTRNIKPSTRNSVFVKYIRPCFAEFLVMVIFVFIGVCSVGGVASFIPLVHGLAVMVLVFMTGGISGGHINPAVTLGVFCAGAIRPILALCYVISQLLGSIVGAALARAVLTKVVYDSINGGAHGLGTDVSVGSGLLAEIIATTLLVLTVQLTAVDSKTKTPVAPIPIGFAIAVGVYAIGTISGGSLNPARSFGPAVVGSYWSDHYIYWIGPLLGSIIASVIYRFMLASPDRLLFWKDPNIPANNTVQLESLSP